MSKCDFVYRLTSCSNDNTFEYIKLNIWKRQEVCLIIQMAIQRVHKLKLDDRHHIVYIGLKIYGDLHLILSS